VTLNIAKKWLSKTSIIQHVFCLLIFRKETARTDRKNARNSNKIQLRSDVDISQNFGQIHKFRSLESRSRISSLESRNFNEVSVSKFQPGLGLEGYDLDYITAASTTIKWTALNWSSLRDRVGRVSGFNHTCIPEGLRYYRHHFVSAIFSLIKSYCI